jgi:ketosteroid isomerase-like protein
MSQQNVELVREAIDAFNRGDLDATVQAAAPDAVLDSSRAIGPYRGVYRLADFRPFIGAFSGTFELVRVEPEEFIDAGEQVVVWGTIYFEGRDGLEAIASGALVWTLRDGRAVRIGLYQVRDEALEAAGLSE